MLACTANKQHVGGCVTTNNQRQNEYAEDCRINYWQLSLSGCNIMTETRLEGGHRGIGGGHGWRDIVGMRIIAYAGRRRRTSRRRKFPMDVLQSRGDRLSLGAILIMIVAPWEGGHKGIGGGHG